MIIIMVRNKMTKLFYILFGFLVGGILAVALDRNNATVLDRPNGMICIYNQKSYCLISIKSSVERLRQIKNLEDWGLAVSSK